MTKLLTNPLIAVVVSVGALVAGATVAAETAGSPDQWAGALVLGLVAGAGGCWVGTTIRVRRRNVAGRPADLTRPTDGGAPQAA
ncbi:hypothetical protein DEJ28_17690 [Curtobacterium sp. MCPF17_002]|uniref:hypothetical protein n=1 Tax=Curtobacterium sp. MCPF17_002 TaxID=2175645 RepID=UPI000DA85B7C|nr:hypothetical protein [Curtobacterium sp. MCPF17_002]WIB77452.1 hypothetical protein DEJ28_17690 [Curtobacterium sp. MCPF17_002]